MSFETIRFDLTNRVATITIDREARMNALTPQVFTDMTAAIDRAIGDRAQAIVLTGAGKAFCSGADLIAGAGSSLKPDLGETIDASYNPFTRKLAALDIPVVTAINGPAVGAGVGLALLGDISVMAREAYLLLSFVNIGLVPDAGATWLVAQSVGRARALEMALLGDRMGADEALTKGLVTRVADDALTEAQAIAARLAAGPAVALGLIRRQVASALTLPLDDTLRLERDNQSRAGFTRDFAEAVKAFGQKRPPRFEGH